MSNSLMTKIEDLLKQATEEKSHYYVGKVLREAKEYIAELEQQINIAHNWSETCIEARDYWRTRAEVTGRKCAELEKDAERYGYALSHVREDKVYIGWPGWPITRYVVEFVGHEHKSLSQAIDAAIAPQPSPSQEQQSQTKEEDHF